MSEPDGYWVRAAGAPDGPVIGEMLHAFNREYDDPTPPPERLARRLVGLIEGGDTVVLLGGAGASAPDGLAVLRFRPAIWSESDECYLAELYVRPQRRRQGLGRTIMLEAMRTCRRRGADYMDLGTGDTDLAARALYESLGFSNTEGRPDGPRNLYYERDLTDIEV